MQEFNQLIALMQKLRDPQSGCVWDREQTPQTLCQYILEEAYELVAAIEDGNAEKVCQEAGDLLLQIVFLAQIFQEQQKFSVREVIAGLNAKLIRRHPHIFGQVKVKNSTEVRDNWEKIKIEEKSKAGVISTYPEAMPALLTAQRIASQVSTVGFDWQDPLEALQKVEEEVAELKKELRHASRQGCAEEIGDLLFALTNVARLLNINAEFALRAANQKFKKRFSYVEARVKESGRAFQDFSLEELEAIWQQSKTAT